jgi:hypothetical protein
MEFLASESIEQLFQFALIVSGRRSVALELMAETISEVEARAAQWREQSHILQWAVRWCWVQAQRRRDADSNAPDLAIEMQSFLGCDAGAERAAKGLICIGVFESAGIARVLGMRVAEVKKISAGVDAQFGLDNQLQARLRDCLATMALNSLEKHQLGTVVRSSPRVRNRFERVLGVFAVLTGALALFGWLGWERWTESEPVQVQGAMGELVLSSREWSREDRKNFEGVSGEVDDWLFLSGLEGAHMSPKLLGIRAVGGRILKWRDSSVAQLALQDAGAFLWVVRSDAAGIGSSVSKSGKLNAPGWTGEWFVDGKYAFLLAAPTTASVDKR